VVHCLLNAGPHRISARFNADDMLLRRKWQIIFFGPRHDATSFKGLGSVHALEAAFAIASIFSSV
jgi:hypothetical protein